MEAFRGEGGNLTLLPFSHKEKTADLFISRLRQTLISIHDLLIILLSLFSIS